MDYAKLNSNSPVEKEIFELIEGKKRLQLFLQPIIYFKEKKIFGYEVLSRGAIESCLTEVSPFDSAHYLGLGKQLDKIALVNIINNLDLFPSEYVFINVYLSNLDFFYNLILGKKFNKKLILEIDFSTELVDIKRVLQDIENIKKNNIVSFAIDDLGKYSLDKKIYDIIMPDFLKVDICVTKGIADDITKQKVLDDIVCLNNKIGAQLICEGIEYISDANYLKKEGLELAQGNIFQKPREFSFFKK